MPNLLQKFVPSPDELNLASRLVETHTGSWNRSDTLSVDAAIGIFKQSGVSFKQLRDIWSIADRDGSGKLSKEELAVVIRLTGWVQAGEVLDERLLEKVGPLPKIKGIPDIVAVPKVDAPRPFPPISFDEMVEFKQKFLDLKPVNGTLQKHQVVKVYMSVKPVLSFDELFRIMQLLDDKSGVFDFKSFALGMHIVRSLHSSLITSVPSFLLPKDYGILDEVDFGDSSLTEGDTKLSDSVPQDRTQSNGVDLPAKVESDILDFMKDVGQHKHISGPLTNKFSSEYEINQTEIAQIWRQSDVELNQKLILARMTMIERLIRQQLAKKLPGSVHLTPLPPSASAQPPSSEHHTSLKPMLPSELPSTRPLPILPTIYPTPSQSSSPESSTVLHEDYCHEFKEEGRRLTSHLEVESRQITALLGLVTDMKTTIKEQHDRPESHDLRLRFLRASVRESEAAAAKAIAEAQDLRQSILSREQEIVELRERLEDAESVQPLSRTNIDMLDFMASACESKAAATRAIAEAQDLRQTVLSQEQEIIELRARLNDMERVQYLSRSSIDMLDLHNDHENLKVQVENIQCLMEQHLMPPSDHTLISANDDAMVAEKVHGHKKTSSMHGVPSPESLHPIVTELEDQSDFTDLPPPFSSLSASQPLPKYAPRASTSGTQLSDKHPPKKASKVDSSPHPQIQFHNPQLEDDFDSFTGGVHHHVGGPGGGGWVSQRVLKLKKVLKKK